jgi:25S rRNA (uracil2634-N3)-methyltransferase
MSKSKTKQERRQLKRDGQRKIAEYHKKAAKANAAAKPASSTAKSPAKPAAKPAAKKQKTTAAEPTQAHVQASQKHEVPFGAYDHILLVGEGDFSFTKSLVEEHGCANVTATSFDTADEVREKYPSFEATRDALTGLTPPVPLHHGIDAAKLSSYKTLRCSRDEDEDEGEAVSGWDTIAFMFPHVGGLSTDVMNRQVRSNQALIAGFFKACLETSSPKQRLRILEKQANKPNLVQRRSNEFLRMGGRVLVALFEGEPYSLWNVRDLARHAGLRVVESWRFDWGLYPGYKHVRTLGALEGGGGWKGEDREARMYVFEKVALEADSEEERELEKMGVKLGKKRRAPPVVRKRKAAEEDDSD